MALTEKQHKEILNQTNKRKFDYAANKYLLALSNSIIYFEVKEVSIKHTLVYLPRAIPLTPMGVLAHRLRTLDRSFVPPST